MKIARTTFALLLGLISSPALAQMAIPALPAAATPTLTDVFPGCASNGTNGCTHKYSVAQLGALIGTPPGLGDGELNGYAPVDPPSVNYLLQSNAFDTAPWTANNVTVARSTTINGTLGQPAWDVTTTATGGYLQQIVSIPAGTQMFWRSLTFNKSRSTTPWTINFFFQGGSSYTLNYTPGTDTLSACQSGATCSRRIIGNTVRITLGAPNAGSTSATLKIYPTGTAGATGTSTIDNDQFEAAPPSAITQLAGSTCVTQTTTVATTRIGVCANGATSGGVQTTDPRLATIDSGNNNLSLGIGALPTSTASDPYNVAIGAGAFGANATGDSGTAVGFNACRNLTDGRTNTCIGYRSGYWMGTGNSNTFIGAYAGPSASGTQPALNGNDNSCLGEAACLFLQGSASFNSALGFNALFANTTGSSNTAMGQGAFFVNLTTGGNSGFGVGAGKYTQGSNGTFAGLNAGQGLNDSHTLSASASVGATSLTFSDSGWAAVGDVLFQGACTVNASTKVTAVSGMNVTIDTPLQNACASGTAFNDLHTPNSGSGNSGFGNSALASITGSAGGNTGLGQNAGSNITTGNNNIAIGNGAQVASPTGSNQLSLGNALYCSGLGGTLKCGFGNSAPTHALEVANDFAITSSTTPVSSSATCSTGQIGWDSSYVYVCVATNTWKRSGLATW